MDDRPSSSIGARTAAVLLTVLLVLYPLSAGPVLRLYNEDLLPEWSGLPLIPLLLVLERAPKPVQDAFETYCDWWLPAPQ